jgi:hypothetical protein
LAFSSLVLLVLGGVITGFGQGLAFRTGPVVGEGILAQVTGLPAAAVAAVSTIVLILLGLERASDAEGIRGRGESVAHAGST